MPAIAFNLNSMKVERKAPPVGKLSINSNVNITNINMIKLNIAKEEEPALKIEFEFNTRYEKDFASILMNGDVIYIGEKKVLEKAVKDWKEKKDIDKNIKKEAMNLILARCNIAAILVAREFNLPSPIPMPRVEEKE
jgi:hypothetical protein